MFIAGFASAQPAGASRISFAFAQRSAAVKKKSTAAASDA
jgi:hypothetical protein